MEAAAGAALIRVAAYPSDLGVPAWPDLASGEPVEWRTWLGAAWELPGFAAAVTTAAPDLAEQITRVVSGNAVPLQRLRRLVEAVVRYLLRWTTRATPFGTFAGVAPVQVGARAAVRVGEAHRAVTRPNGEFIAEHTARAEQNLVTLRTVAVVTNSLGYQRGGKWVLPCARAEGDRRWDAEIRLTAPVEAAIQAARSPVGFAELTAKIAGPTDETKAERLLADLVHAGVLLSALRPAMTVTDPLAYATRRYAAPDPGDRVAVDLRADVAVTLPPAAARGGQGSVDAGGGGAAAAWMGRVPQRVHRAVGARSGRSGPHRAERAGVPGRLPWICPPRSRRVHCPRSAARTGRAAVRAGRGR
jgi:hypothetical protein